MHPQATAADQARRERRRAVIEDHYAPLTESDLEELATCRWLAVSEDRGEHHLTSHPTFDALCDETAGEILDDGRIPLCAYDLDTGRAFELHVSTPVVSRAQVQGVRPHPALKAVR